MSDVYYDDEEDDFFEDDEDDWDDDDDDDGEYIETDLGLTLYMQYDEAAEEARERDLAEFVEHADPCCLVCVDHYDDGVDFYHIVAADLTDDTRNLKVWIDVDMTCDLDEPLKGAILDAIDEYKNTGA